MSRKPSLLQFVRGLVNGQTATCRGLYYQTPDGRRGASGDVRALIEAGALSGNKMECRANRETAGWLKRAMIDCDAFQAQHRMTELDAQGRQINLKESPLARLASGETAFLERHHVEAGERVRRLVDRAQLRQRTTMNYSGIVGDGNARGGGADLSDLAADARTALAEIHRALPAECAGVVLDVCGWLKGLQEVERERGWPRRSAKLVLRIGLDQLAHVYGIGPYAVGRDHAKPRAWLEAGARPEMRV
jgi:hypothetical protein